MLQIKYIGVDPGKSGAITELYEDGSIAQIYDMPLTPDKSKVSNTELTKIFRRYNSHVVFVLEESHAMRFTDKDGQERSQSVSSMLTYGKHWGVLLGLILMTGARYHTITPQQWQTKFKVKGKQRGYNSVSIAQKIFPNHLYLPFAEKNNRAKNGIKLFDGRSDSALLARWGFECHKAATKSI